MRQRMTAMIVLGLLCLPLRAAVVEKIDDTQTSGNPVSVSDGQLTIKPISAKPPATQESIPFSEIARVSFRPAAAAVVAAPEPEAQAAPQQQPRGAIAFIISGLFNNGDPNMPVNTGPAPADVAAPAEIHAEPATRPLASIDWTVNLSGGDQLHGKIADWSEQKLSLKIGPMTQPVEIPPSRLSRLWCGSADDVKKAKALDQPADAQDTAFVLKDADVIAVKGQVLGAQGESLRFRYGDQERKIALGRLVGVVLAASPASNSSASYQSVELEQGDRLSGIWTGMDDKTITLKTAWGAGLKIPISAVTAIDFLNGRLIYLSDLKPVKVEQTPYFGRVIPWRVDRALDGGPLRLAGAQFAKGIAVHTRTVLEYDVSGFERFRATVGFEPGAGDLGEAVIRVIGDGKTLYENAEARGGRKPVDMDLDLRGISRLRLEADFGKGQDVGGRIVWANARLLRPEAK